MNKMLLSVFMLHVVYTSMQGMEEGISEQYRNKDNYHASTHTTTQSQVFSLDQKNNLELEKPTTPLHQKLIFEPQKLESLSHNSSKTNASTSHTAHDSLLDLKSVFVTSQQPVEKKKEVSLEKKSEDTTKTVIEKKTRSEVDKKKDAALFEAAKKGNVELARQLLESGADVNAYHVTNPGARYEHKTTAFHHVCDGSSLDMFKLLLSYKPNLMALGHFGWDESTPLSIVARCGFVEGARLILESNDIVDKVSYINGEGLEDKPLYLAVRHDHSKMIQFLVEQGADKNLTSRYGDNGTMLHVATDTYIQVKTMKTLLDCGFNVNAKSGKHNQTPLHQVAKNSVVEILDAYKKTPHSCIEKVELLITYDADLNAQDDEGRTPLHIAAEHDRVDICALLISKGAQLTIPDKKGILPFETALCNGSLQVVHFLLSEGCRLDKTFDEHMHETYLLALSKEKTVGQLLREAIVLDNAQTAEFLIKKGINVNEVFVVKPKNYYDSLKKHRSLLDAIEYDARKVLEVLLRYGGDITLRNDPKSSYWAVDYSPLETALSAQKYALIPLLLQGAVEYKIASQHNCVDHGLEKGYCQEHKRIACQIVHEILTSKANTVDCIDLGYESVEEKRLHHFLGVLHKLDFNQCEKDDMLLKMVQSSKTYAKKLMRLFCSTLTRPKERITNYTQASLGLLIMTIYSLSLRAMMMPGRHHLSLRKR
jgi:ankyrin repeat protein